MAESYVINVVGHGNRKCAGADIEGHLNRAGAVTIKTLHHDGGGAEDERLGKTQL